MSKKNNISEVMKMEHEYIIAHADKSVLKISGLEVKGLNTKQLEQILGEKLHTFVRVIGVTGDNIEMDVYDIEPEQVRKNEKGLIERGDKILLTGFGGGMTWGTMLITW